MNPRPRTLAQRSFAACWIVLGCTVLSVSCGGAPAPLATPAALSVAQALESRTCLPGRFVGALVEPRAPCPAAREGWRVYKHRSAAVVAGRPGPADDRPVPQLIAASCSYVWAAAGQPDTSGLPRAPAGWLQPLCVEEPPLPQALRETSCPAGLQIGLRPPGLARCPSVAGWNGGPLFPEKAGELGQFCQYTAASNDAPDPDTGSDTVLVSADADTAGLPSWVHGDCAAVGALATSGQRQAMEDAFKQATEALPTLPLVSGGLQPAHVRVAVVDSALDRRDDGLPGAGQSSHGRTMGVVVARLGCPVRGGGSACTVDVQNEPALWLERSPTGLRRNRRGGFFGTQADLAAAIVAAVDAAPPGGPLVVNISLGWAREFGGAEPSLADFPPAVRAVFAAIEYARCHGAVVIASAGNATGSPATPLGPLLPGRWETRPAPSVARCHDLGVAAPTPPAAGRPLLYAAGGVDHLDRPLFNTPLLGRPRLAAPASNAAREHPLPPWAQPHGAFTGSSVAAAVTSAAVAVAWSYLPGQSGDAAVDRVHDSAVDLILPADFCPGGAPCASIRRVSICRTARAACLAAGALCDAVPVCPMSGARTAPADLPDLAAMHAGACSAPDGGNICVPAAPPRFHDAWQLPLIQRQPTDPICTVCGMSTGWWDLDLDTNPANASTLFTTEGVALWDTLGSLWIGTAWNPALRFYGGTDVSSGLDLSLLAPPVSWARADFSHWQFNGYFGASVVVEGQWLYIMP